MRFEGRRVYLTGATGFIGGALARRLLAEGATLTTLVRPQTSATELERLGARVVRGDVTDPATLDLSKQDIVIHAAAWVGFGIPKRKVELFRRTNIEGTRHVVEAAERAHVGKLVHISSIAALGATGDQPATEETPRASFYKSEYERTKSDAHEIAAHAKVPVAIPMPGLVLGRGGPFDPLLKALVKGRIPALPGDDAVKGWVHVDDVVDAVLTMALRGTGPYLLVDENMRTTELLVAGLEEAVLPIPRLRVPTNVLLGGAALLQGGYHLVGKTPPVSEELVRALKLPMSYDSTRARKELSWRPELIQRLAEDLRVFARS